MAWKMEPNSQEVPKPSIFFVIICGFYLLTNLYEAVEGFSNGENWVGVESLVAGLMLGLVGVTEFYPLSRSGRWFKILLFSLIAFFVVLMIGDWTDLLPL